MIIFGELEFQWYLNQIHFMCNYFGRGLFKWIMGSLAFAVFGIDGVLSLIVLIFSPFVMLIGLLQILYYFYTYRSGEVEEEHEISISTQDKDSYTTV
jgi:hypothetical protein